MDKQNDNFIKLKFKKEYKENIEKEKRREKIHSEICYLINKNMENIENKLNNINKDGIMYFDYSKNIDKINFLNYTGEKISIISNTNSNIQTIEKEETNKNDAYIKHRKIKYRNEKNTLNFNYDKNKNKNLYKINVNIKNMLFSNKKDNNTNNGIESNIEKETIVNTSNFGEIKELFDKIEHNNSLEENENILVDKKKEIKIRNMNIHNNIFKSPQKRLNDNKNSKIFLKDSHRILHTPSFSLFDSTSTSNTYKKDKNKFKFNQILDNSYNNIYLKYNKTELMTFFSEINLPTIYAEKFIENGFDDLNIILSLTKTSIAITNQNLKDIGILNAGHRAQILIHLEEKAEIFPFSLEKNIIYNNKNSKNLNNNSLFKFLNKIGCKTYINNFRRNGYFNSELLFSQMFTREPINKEMLSEDFCIDKEENIDIIMSNLNLESKNYRKKLKRKNINTKIIFDDKIYRNSCESCIVF